MKTVKAQKKKGKLVIKVKEGALHEALDMPMDKKMSSKDIAVHEGDSTLMKKRKIFAQNAKKWKK